MVIETLGKYVQRSVNVVSSAMFVVIGCDGLFGFVFRGVGISVDTVGDKSKAERKARR